MAEGVCQMSVGSLVSVTTFRLPSSSSESVLRAAALRPPAGPCAELARADNASSSAVPTRGLNLIVGTLLQCDVTLNIGGPAHQPEAQKPRNCCAQSGTDFLTFSRFGNHRRVFTRL